MAFRMRMANITPNSLFSFLNAEKLDFRLEIYPFPLSPCSTWRIGLVFNCGLWLNKRTIMKHENKKLAALVHAKKE